MNFADDDRPVVTRRLPSIEYEENSEFHYKLLDQTVPEDADIILGFSTSPGVCAVNVDADH